MSGFKRFSLTSCALLLSLSNIAYADTETTTETPVVDYEKGYILTPADSQTDTTITKYELNTDTGKLEAKYYNVELTKTQYGNPNGEITKTFGWEENDDGKLEFIENPTNPVGQTIEYRYTEQGFTKTEIGKENDLGTITNPTGSSYAHSQYIGGAVINNPKGTTISLDNVLYKDNITKALIRSTTSASKYADVLGGAVYNEGTISSITGAFINNSINVTGNRTNGNLHTDSYGGAIANKGTIESIAVDFIGNSTTTSNSSSSYSYYSYSYSNGGAIYNNGDIGDIIGDFIGNSSSASSRNGGASYSNGGAIYNNGGTIGDITGDFIGNFTTTSASSRSYYSRGGAIYNNGDIGDIIGDFIGNSTTYSSKYSPHNSNGGAIYNNGDIGDIMGDFIGNFSASPFSYDSYSNGGAIYNDGAIGDITGDFIGNSTSGNYSNGGAIYNNGGTIGDITGDFIGNSSGSYGGVIYNGGTIGDITGDFIGNSSGSYGGAIYNDSRIGTLDENNNLVGGIFVSFIGNYATTTSTSRLALGGAVYTTKDMNFIANAQTHTISGNYTEDATRSRVENAIFVATSSSSSPIITFKAEDGGKYLIYDQIEGGSVSGTTISYDYGYNLALTGDGTGIVGLYNDIINADVKTDNVTVDFVNNEIKEYDFVSMNSGENTKLNVDLDLATGTADSISTEEASSGTITLNILNFMGAEQDPTKPTTFQIIKNGADSSLELALGDNINVLGNVDPETPVENVLENIPNTVYNDEIYAQEGGISLGTTDTKNDSVIVQKDKVYDTLALIVAKDTDEERNFIFRTADKYVLSTDLDPAGNGVLNINGLGAANPSTIDANGHTLFNLNDETTLNITNTTIENAKDYAIKAENSSSAINLTNTSIKNTAGTAIASNVDVNLTADNGKSEFSGNTTAINMNDSGKTINITAKNAGEVVLDDEITGTSLYNLKLTGDKTGKVTLNNKVSNANTTLEEVTLHLTKADILASSTLTANSGHLSLMNGIAETQVMQGMNINGHLGMSVDVDLQAAKMDRLPENVVVSPDAQIDVENLNLLNDAKGDKTDIQFADSSYSNQVSYTGKNPVAYSPIYKYDVSYNKDDGFFTFLRGGASSGNASDGFNPAVLSTGVAAQSGAYATQMNTFQYAFQHLDNFMNLPYMERLAIKNQNRYALTSSAESGIFSPTYAENLGVSYWIKPYVSFESIPLNNGPKVDNINYGTLIGFDGEMKPIAHGFDRVLSGYVGYNGASQSYNGVDSYQNGGLLGGTMFLYKGNFFNATTLSAGASIGENHNMYGNEDFTMLLAGIGNRLGYNFEFKGGKYIIQPSMLMSYTFVNTFDYTNSAGLNIESDPMHVIQLSPGVKFIMNTRNGWQPYATVNMVWNIMDSQKVTANAVRLPEMSVDPYVQYGLGVQKRIKDKFVAFGQALVSNGGRNGVSLTFGLRWFLGKE